MSSTYRPQTSDIGTLLAGRASRQPSEPAFIDASSDKTLGWADIAHHAEVLGAIDWLSRRAGRRVGLLVADPTQFCRTYLAGLGANLCICPLDPRCTAEELEDKVEVLGLTDLFCDAEMAQLGATVAQGRTTLWRADGAYLSLESWTTAPRGLRSQMATPAVILATSGTSGDAKLVPLTQRQLVHTAAHVSAHHRLTPRDRGYSPLPLFHVNAQVVGLLATLVSGQSLIVDRRFSRRRFWQAADRLQATWLNLVPAILAALSETPPAAELAGQVRFARSASSMLAEPIQARFESSTGIRVLETYGMTEAASQITANPLAEHERRRGTAGIPVGVELRITDQDDGSAAGPGCIGMVEIRGPAVIDGYLAHGGAPGRIEATTPEGWLRTGDLGWQDSDGFLTLVGRNDDAINRGGEKVYPREIEEVLLRDPRVTAAAAVGRPHTTLGTEPIAFVTTSLAHGNPARAELVTDLHSASSAALTAYKQPAEILVADVLPASSTGKISRKALSRELYLEASAP